MDSQRWERVQSLFHATADLPESERLARLESECAGDSSLMREVLTLLAEDAGGGSLLDRDLPHLAAELLSTPLAPALLAQEFGAYRISSVLGEGGMGVVYLARRNDLGSQAAIKILRDAWLSPARRERFAAEQRTLAQLHHPAIAQIFDAGSLADGTPWFVMEYVEGVPLTTYCTEHASSIPERLRLFRSVCEAVQHAHRHLIIHRDLKPSNILVSRDGGVKLLDFGISKQLESLDVPVDQTRTGLRLMTPAYAAPEQLRAGQVGIHTDIYSLGVVLYELLVGRLPFDLSDRTPSEAAAVILEREPERPSAAVLRMPLVSPSSPRRRGRGKAAWADLDVLCLTAMHKDPQRRYRSVEALMRDVDHYLGGEPLEARPDTMGYRVGKFVRRNWRGVSAAALAVSVLAGLVVFYTLRVANARNSAVSEAARAERIEHFMLDLFQGGDEAAGPAESLRVVTLLDRGVREAGTLASDPLVQADISQTLGDIYQKLGDLDRADSLLQGALAARRSRLGPEHADVARNLVALGMLRNEQAKYDEAEQLVRTGLAMTRRSLPPEHPAVANANLALGEVLVSRGEYARAIPSLEEAVRVLSAVRDTTPDLSTGLTDLANAHFFLGHYAVSDSVNRQVLALDRRLYGARHPSVGEDLINLGAIQSEWGHFADAEAYYRQALDIIRAWYGPDHPETASTLTSLGRALVAEHRDGEAEEMLRQALSIEERVYGKVHPRVASTLNELGTIAQREGRLDEAEADFTRMAAIYKSVYSDRHYLIGIALSNLAGVYLARNQYPRAEREFREVLRRYADVLQPGHRLIGIAHVRLGHTLVRENRIPEAIPETRAGMDILTKQTDPPVQWVTMGREDLGVEGVR
ncbi:MAG: serine/threonine-protein kinase [Gemmatimonadota bacterium]